MRLSRVASQLCIGALEMHHSETVCVSECVTLLHRGDLPRCSNRLCRTATMKGRRQ